MNRGSKVAELRYHPWGGTRYTSGTAPTSYQFTGQRNDAATYPAFGLYFYNARYYDPYLNRFISPDRLYLTRRIRKASIDTPTA